jgi:cytochrome c oxidase cbb3-type subunit 3
MSEESSTTPSGQYARKKGEVVLRDHQFDGIQEFDQKLPNWWLFTFYGAIVFFVAFWFLYYQMKAMPTDDQRIRAAMTQIQEKKNKELEATLASLSDSVLINEWSKDAAVTSAGEMTFMANCVACHSADLSATMVVNGQKIPLPGRPLNDGIWEYGNKPMDLFKVINLGTPQDSKGFNNARMTPWGQLLSPKQVAEVVAYLISKNPRDFPAAP